ncbi:MAG: tRNA (guanosine(46)-N7)-methyltransferase TrmB [Clostridia bacterium]|nr:tRNA (guanosine(46)-N7)-methyltransferase TrmB [Clostridia bacterium]
MRKKKHGEERLSACKDFLVSKPEASAFQNNKSVFLEIGAGKGGFAVGMCEKHPDVSYFAMERVTDCVVLAAELAKRKNEKSSCCKNLKFIIDTADNLTKLFDNGSVDKIFLNFSDPWSKKGYAKRRLTHRRYLAVYFNLLKDGGTLTFKTDNVGLFDFSLEEIEAIGLECEVVTRDLHASEYASHNVVTEYEAAFSSQGVKINMLKVRKPVGFEIEIPENLSRDFVAERYK